MNNQAKTENISANSGENTGFSATGSQKTGILEQNQTISQDTSKDTIKNPPQEQDFNEKNPNFEENSGPSVDNSQNSSKNSSSKQFSEEKTDNSGKNPENTRILSPSELIFTEESIKAFNSAFPTQDAEKLKKNKDFQAFISILTPNLSLCDIYSRFSALSASIEENAQKKLAQAIANASSGVGSLSSSEPNTDTFFTKEQVLRMSAEQISKNYAKIRRSQEKW